MVRVIGCAVEKNKRMVDGDDVDSLRDYRYLATFEEPVSSSENQAIIEREKESNGSRRDQEDLLEQQEDYGEEGEDYGQDDDEEYEESETVEEDGNPSDTYDDASAVDEDEAAYENQPAAGLSPRLVLKRAVETLQVNSLHHPCSPQMGSLSTGACLTM